MVKKTKSLIIIFIIFIIISFYITGCDISIKDTYLKKLAAAKNITIGTLYNYAYSNSSYQDYKIYNKIIVEEFDIYALEWEF